VINNLATSRRKFLKGAAVSSLGAVVLSGLGKVEATRIKNDKVLTDIINEETANSGVTIETVLVKDGLVDGIDVDNHGNDAHSSVFEDQANKSVASGYASLDAGGKVPASELPSIQTLPTGAGIEFLYTIISNGDGTCNVPANSACFLNDAITEIERIVIAENTSLGLTDASVNCICADRDTGTWVVFTSTASIDYIRYLPYAEIYRNGNNLHIQTSPNFAYRQINRNFERIASTQRYARESGLDGLAVDGSLNITSNTGRAWATFTPFDILAISSVTTWFFCHHESTLWVNTYHANTPVIDNLQYDDGTDLAALTAGYWTINYLYRGIENQDHLYIVLGDAEYATSDLAKASSTIASLPELITSHAMLIGRVIVQKSATTGIICESAFDTIYAGSSAITHHGDLVGLLDDDHTQYQKESEKDAVSGYAGLDASQLVIKNPANATATSTASKIPIADGSGKLDTWVTDGSTTVKGKVELATDGEVASGVVVQGNDVRLSDARTPLAHNQDANTITTGTLDGDRLPAISETKKGGVPLTGTPAGKYLKDDGTWATIAGGGDVVGPASSVDNRVVFFNGLTGKIIKDSGLLLSGSNSGDQVKASAAELITGTDDVKFATALAIAGHTGLERTANKNAANGYAGLTTSLLNGDQLPALSTTKKGGCPMTGTPSGKFLKDDNTWATPSGSGGGVQTLKTTGDQIINGTAFQNITDLTFPVLANTDYAFDFYITFRSTIATGFRFSVNGPAGVVDFMRKYQTIANSNLVGVATWLEGHSVAFDTMTVTTASIAAGVDLHCRITGRFKCGGAGGTFACRAASESANNDLVIQKGSWGTYF